MAQAPAPLNRADLVIQKTAFIKTCPRAIRKINYIAHRDHTGYLNPESLSFDATQDRTNGDAFATRLQNTWTWNAEKRAKMFDMMISFDPQFYQSEKQMMRATREMMREYETYKGVDVDWVAAVHLPVDKGTGKLKPHVHLLINPVGRVHGLHPDDKQSKRTRLIRLTKDDAFFLRNEWKRNISGMRSVSRENCFEHEEAINDAQVKHRAEWEHFKAVLKTNRRVNQAIRGARIVGRALDNRPKAGNAQSSRHSTMWDKFLNDRAQKERGLWDNIDR